MPKTRVTREVLPHVQRLDPTWYTANPSTKKVNTKLFVAFIFKTKVQKKKNRNFRSDSSYLLSGDMVFKAPAEAQSTHAVTENAFGIQTETSTLRLGLSTEHLALTSHCKWDLNAPSLSLTRAAFLVTRQCLAATLPSRQFFIRFSFFGLHPI